MSQQTKFDTSISRTPTAMVKKVKQLRLEACAIKEPHSYKPRVRRISLFWHQQHLGTIRQQSEHRKIEEARFRMADDHERVGVPKEDRGTNDYIAAFALPMQRW